MHADRTGPIIVLLDRQRVIQVRSASWVDCKDTVFSEVLANFKLPIGDTAESARLAQT